MQENFKEFMGNVIKTWVYLDVKNCEIHTHERSSELKEDAYQDDTTHGFQNF